MGALSPETGRYLLRRVLDMKTSQITNAPTPTICAWRGVRLVAFSLVVALAGTACGSASGEASSPDPAIERDTPIDTDRGNDTDTAGNSDAGELVSEEVGAPGEEIASAAQDPGPSVLDDEPGPPDPVVAKLENGRLATSGQRVHYMGTIDGATDFTMSLSQEGTFVRGEISYNSSPLTVLGTQTPQGWYLLREFDDGGRVTGSITIDNIIDGVIVDGAWGDADMEMSATGIDSNAYDLAPVLVVGDYGYAVAPFDDENHGPMGSMTISEITNSGVVIRLDANRGGPSFNMATVDTVELPRDGNIAVVDTTENGLDCALAITMFDGFAVVDYLDERTNCGFGNAASVVGIYVYRGPASGDSSAGEASSENTETGDVATAPLGAALTDSTFGPFELGQTWSTLTEDFGVEPFGSEQDLLFDGCYYVEIPGVSGSGGVALMLLNDGDNDDPSAAVVSRIEPLDLVVATSSGIGFGSTEADVLAAHDGAVSAESHVYLGDGAKYLTVSPADGAGSTILYETDETGTVISIRNGYVEPIKWVEGCA